MNKNTVFRCAGRYLFIVFSSAFLFLQFFSVLFRRSVVDKMKIAGGKKERILKNDFRRRASIPSFCVIAFESVAPMATLLSNISLFLYICFTIFRTLFIISILFIPPFFNLLSGNSEGRIFYFRFRLPLLTFS